MKIVALIDSFKDAMSSQDIDGVLDKYLQSRDDNTLPDDIHFDVTSLHISDGGEGFVSAMSHSLNQPVQSVSSFNALGQPMDAEYVYDHQQRLLVLESAQCAGIQQLKKEQRNPFVLGTYGLGLQLLTLLERFSNNSSNDKTTYQNGDDNAVKTVILGLGGTATVDCGIGVLSCLGCRFFTQDNIECCLDPYNLSQFHEIARIDCTQMDPKKLDLFRHMSFQLAADVTNPLLGENGAVYIFGPQKGLKPDQLNNYDAAMANFASCLERDLHVPEMLKDQPGAGAAGGIGYIFSCIFAYIDYLHHQNHHSCNAAILPKQETSHITILSGFELLLKYNRYIETAISQADVVLTGEGSFDSQSIQGKVVSRVAQFVHAVKSQNQQQMCPILVICGISSFPYTFIGQTIIRNQQTQQQSTPNSQNSQSQLQQLEQLGIDSIFSVNIDYNQFVPKENNFAAYSKKIFKALLTKLKNPRNKTPYTQIYH